MDPWLVAGDFNCGLHENEKTGGAAFNYAFSLGFHTALTPVISLILATRVPFILPNMVPSWQNLFPHADVFHLPLECSDYVGLLIHSDPHASSSNHRPYFQFLDPWFDHDDFLIQVKHSWSSTNSCPSNISRLTKNLKIWNYVTFSNIFRRKHGILQRLEGINRLLLILAFRTPH